MRQLASIQTVNAVEPIEGADAIEKIQVLGWWVVVKKGEHKPGDKVVYCEIDSLLPERPEFEFLRANCFKPAREDGLPAGFRIKTMKLRGQVSQGICFPLSILPDGTPTDVDTDVTEALGIVKWEPLPPSMCLGGGAINGRTFPDFIAKTDETRVQNLRNGLTRHQGKTFYVTEKLDGTSFTAFVKRGEFGVCSRNVWLDLEDDTHFLVKFAKDINLETRLRATMEMLGFDLAIQGEVIGPGIQKNKYGLSAYSLRVFNVINLDTNTRVYQPDALAIVKDMGLESVPQLGTITLNHTTDELVAMSEAMSLLNGKVQREGIVLRPLAEEYDRDFGGRLSFKVINPKFLLKYDE